MDLTVYHFLIAFACVFFAELTLLTGNKYSVRAFEQGDESDIVSLFNKEYGKYGGFPDKTVEYWRWSYLQRPDVKPDGIFVVQDEKSQLSGYAVVGDSGNIWELCYDSEKDGEEIISILLSSSISYLNKLDAPSAALNAPVNDELLSQQCRKFGFSTRSSPLICLSIIDYQELLTLIITGRHLESQMDQEITIRLRNGKSSAKDSLFLTLKDGKVQASSEIGNDSINGIYLETDEMTFSGLILGDLSPTKSYLSFKLMIRPFWKSYSALRFLSSLQLRLDWCLQLGDYV